MNLLDKTKFEIEYMIKSLGNAFSPVVLAFSGGKDSQVVYHICREIGFKFEARYHVTSVDPPELVRFIRAKYPSVVFSKPKVTMWNLIVKEGVPPTVVARYCCDKLKEERRRGITITGVRKEESTKRALRPRLHIRSRWEVVYHPIHDWTELDVWEYLDGNNIEHCILYDEGYSRIGCIGCPMKSIRAREIDFERYPQYKKAYINAFDLMVERRREQGLRTKHTPWIDGEDVFKWWMNPPNKKRISASQLNLGLG